MEKLYKLNWAVIFSLIFFASCSLNKTHQGFGGGFHVPQKSQSSKQSESSFKISNHSTDVENNLAIPEFVNSVQTQIIGKNVVRNSNKMNGISNSNSLKKLVNPSNVNSNNTPSITQPSIGKSFNASYKSNSDTGAKVGMWIFWILGFPIAIIGFIVTLVGLTDNLLGGADTANAGLVILVLGLLMLWRAFKISKRLKRNK
jgi:hypothetical protein